MAPPAAIEGTVRADLFRLLKAHNRTRGASREALSPSFATILRALKKNHEATVFAKRRA
jgi:hypothetical protein